MEKLQIISMAKNLLDSTDFSDIKENNDGTYDATKGKYRYKGLYLKSFEPAKVEGSIESIPLELRLVDEEKKEIRGKNR